MKGLTLLETLIAIGIFSFVIAGIFGVLGIGGTSYNTNLNSLNLQREARQGMGWLIKEARKASWATLQTPGPDANGNFSITFDTPDQAGVSYSVVHTVVAGKDLWQLHRTVPGGAPQIRANDVTVLTASKDPVKHILNMQMQTSKTFSSFGQNRTLTFSLTERIQIRNA